MSAERSTARGPAKRGVKTKILGACLLFLGLMDSLLAWRGGLEPSVLYSPAVLEAVATGAVTGAAHITGGGLPGNLGRPIPQGLSAHVYTTTWRPPDIFTHLAETGDIDRGAMFEAFNMGIGFCLMVRPERLSDVMGPVADHAPVVIGKITEDSEPVVLF